MIVRLLLLGAILCVTVLVSADGSIHDVVKRQAFGQRGRFRLRHPPTTEEASEEKTSASPPAPPSLLTTGAPRRSRLRIRLRPTTTAEPQEAAAPRVQPAVRTHPQSAPPEEDYETSQEEEDDSSDETSAPHTDPPKVPSLPLPAKRPHPRLLPPRPSFTTLAASTTKQSVKETPKPTIKIVAKQTEKLPSSGPILSSPFDGLSQPSPEDLEAIQPASPPPLPPPSPTPKVVPKQDSAESNSQPPSRTSSSSNRRTGSRFRSRTAPSSRVAEEYQPPQSHPVPSQQRSSSRTVASRGQTRYRPPTSTELDYEDETEPPVRSTSSRRTGSRGRQTLDPPPEEIDDIPHRQVSSSRGRRPYRYRPRQQSDYDEEEPVPRRSQSTRRRTRYRTRPSYEDDRLDQVPASNRRAPSRARDPYVDEEPDYEDDYDDLPPPPPPRRSQGFRSRSRPRYRPQSQYDSDDYPDEPPPKPRTSTTTTTTPTTTTTTTTTPAPRPNATVVPGKYRPRQDGRFVGYLSDPNYPRELIGVDLTDYPFYITVPDDIDFDCEDRHDGYYASVPHFCQVFHYCAYGKRHSFLCPNYTLYDQTTFTCRFVNDVDCAASPRHYSRNDELYVETTTLSEEEQGDASKKKRKKN